MQVDHLKVYLLSLARDNRISVWHMAVVFAVMNLAKDGDCFTGFLVSRSKIMKLARIKSAVTYHKCLSELIDYGYLEYEPSYHPRGSTMSLRKTGY